MVMISSWKAFQLLYTRIEKQVLGTRMWLEEKVGHKICAWKFEYWHSSATESFLQLHKENLSKQISLGRVVGIIKQYEGRLADDWKFSFLWAGI